MTEHADKRVVLLALASIRATGTHTPEEIAKRTPDYRTPTAHGKAQPLGERRVRKALAELHDEGLVIRTRSFYGGHRYRALEKDADS